MRVIAVDWSGDKGGGANTIWLAEAVDGQIVRLENGRSRKQLVDHLIKIATTESQVIAGLDFAFGMPSWFARKHGASSGPALWSVVAQEGETWLAEAPFPFYGKGGIKQPKDVELLRLTEKACKGAKSTFLINVPGAVGSGSIRGMPFLQAFRINGWAVWPFDAPACPLLIEIYPRILTGPVQKSSWHDRRSYLKTHYPHWHDGLVEHAVASEDAFDASVSALVMDRHREMLSSLPDLSADPIDRKEGRIWSPSDPIFHSSDVS